MTKNERDVKRLRKVVKGNELIQKTRYDLSVQQQKLLMYVISNIRPEDTELKPQQFTLRELCEVCGISLHPQNLQYVADNIKKIADISYWIDIDGNYVLCRWFKEASIDKDKNNLITIELDNKLKPYLLQLNQFFTAYLPDYIYPMQSKYSIRLYELLKSYENIEVFRISVEDLKLKLQTAEYDRYTNFKNWVIEPAIKEINQYTDLVVTFKPIREGRNITKLCFDIKSKSSTESAVVRLKNYDILEGNIAEYVDE